MKKIILTILGASLLINHSHAWNIKACRKQHGITHCYMALFDDNNTNRESVGYYPAFKKANNIKRDDYSLGDYCSDVTLVDGTEIDVKNIWSGILFVYETNKAKYNLFENNCCRIAQLAWEATTDNTNGRVAFPFGNANLGIGIDKSLSNL